MTHQLVPHLEVECGNRFRVLRELPRLDRGHQALRGANPVSRLALREIARHRRRGRRRRRRRRPRRGLIRTRDGGEGLCGARPSHELLCARIGRVGEEGDVALNEARGGLRRAKGVGC